MLLHGLAAPATRCQPLYCGFYRDAFRLLLGFAHGRLGRAPSELQIEQLDVEFLAEFLEHLELERHNSPRTRNSRLSAIHSFFRYVAISEPALALQCQRVLAMPPKRHERSVVEFLAPEEVAALIKAPDTGKWIGRRDRALLMLAIQTGLRNSELTALRCQDLLLLGPAGAHVRCLGKGRKSRCTPMTQDVAAVLKEWVRERCGEPAALLFPSSSGGKLSADALQRLVRKHVITAGQGCASLKEKRVTPHTLRHTAAMALLQRGVDLTVIALWLGHESTETTQIYLHADMQLKERALAHGNPSGVVPERFRAADPLIVFLESL